MTRTREQREVDQRSITRDDLNKLFEKIKNTKQEPIIFVVSQEVADWYLKEFGEKLPEHYIIRK